MAQQKREGQKGNPAHKRMSNPNLKARRAASWLRGQKRKAARIKAQKEREAYNAALRAQGLPTPYEVAQARRRERYLARKRQNG